MKKFLRILIISALVLCTLLICACGAKKEDAPAQTGFEASDEITDFVQLDIEGRGSIVIELYPDIAPITVENFQKLVSEGFYDGLIFHHVIKGFMIQGGDPTGTGFYGSDTTIKGEFAVNGVQNDLSHERGVVSMARNSLSYDSASSQFFIVHQNAPHLDGQYAAFGRVISGMDVVDAIASVSTDANNKPNTDVVIKQAHFVTK